MRKIAFLVGNDTFPKDPSIPPLRFTQNDARELAEVLEDRETCNFETRLYLNRPSQEVLTGLEQVSGELGQDDTLLFYYSGHGKLRGNELCLVSNETITASLGATSIRTRLVLEYLQGSLARRRILILDCCHSGAISSVFKAVDSKSALDGLADSFGSYILTASTSIELAEEREKDGHGVFTKALIDCLREGPKDRITINDLYDYAHSRLKVSARQTPLFWALQQEGTSAEIGNYQARHKRERQRKREQLERERRLERERLERERQLERERLERERQQERERLIATARTRLGDYVALGELTGEQAEEAVALLKRDEARLFPRDRRYRDDLISFSKGEASFLEVFGAGHSMRPEPAPKPPEDQVAPPITPPVAPAVDAPLTPSQPPTIDQLVTSPEPAMVDQFVTAPEPAVAEEPVMLAEPPVVDQPIAPPEQTAPLGLTGNGGTVEIAKWKPPTQEPRPISATGVLFVTGIALAVIILGSYLFLDSTKKVELSQPRVPSTLNLPPANPPISTTVPETPQQQLDGASPAAQSPSVPGSGSQGVVPQGWIGVEIQPVTQEIADSLGLKSPKGAIVTGVVGISPAGTAGLKSGDMILSIEGEPIDGPPDIARKAGALGPGKKADVVFWRDGSEKTTSVTLGSHLPGDVMRLVETFPDGRRYDGEFRDGKWNGQGVLTFANGERYEGEFRDSKYNGLGVLNSANGDRYDGEFRNGQYNGHGVMTWRNGQRYDGQWRDNERNGHGVLTLINGMINGDRYDGEYLNDKYNGHGVYTHSGGQRYEGEFRDGKANGFGVQTWPDGQRYDGQWRDDKMNGHGVLTFAKGKRKGDRYEGEFLDGTYNGYGVYTYANGYRYDGE